MRQRYPKGISYRYITTLPVQPANIILSRGLLNLSQSAFVIEKGHMSHRSEAWLPAKSAGECC